MKKVLISAILLLVGCVSTQSVINNFAPKWFGKDFDDFVYQYGAPYSKHEMSNGMVMYRWSSTASVAMPATTVGHINSYGNVYTATAGGGNVDLGCVLEIGVDKKDNTIYSMRIAEDTWGKWTTSMCHEVLK